MSGALAVDAVVFDLDGTLIDSERAIVTAAEQAFADVGARVTQLQVADHLGAPLEELYALFVGDDDDARMRRFIARYVARHDEHPDRFPPPLPGVVDGLSALGSRGLSLAVGTTKPSARASSQLEAAGLLGFFAHVQGTDPGMRPKPHPDVVERACAALGVAPARALMVGDTPRDVGAAHAAGAAAVVVAYSEERRRAAAGFGAHAVIASLVELGALTASRGAA
ncbi:MAG: HAD-IA family hydrolase [Deltaproteobacteria bacterium]|nr:HAD-IA family hydrolase [Deltaproteobacteria bacterium]